MDIQNHMMEKGDTTGPQSAQYVLRSYCRICCFRNCKGIYYALDLVSVFVIITNIQEDHLGISDIHSLEDLAKVKATVVKPSKDGWAILNGDDAHCIRLGAELNCNVAYFSLDEESPFIKKLS
jgi:cyanophycin synthetase